MEPSDFVGMTFEARSTLRLPRGRIVAPGETFRLLQMHVDRGVRPDLWIKAGNAVPVEDRPQRVPANRATRGGSRRSRRSDQQAGDGEVPAEGAQAPAEGGDALGDGEAPAEGKEE